MTFIIGFTGACFGSFIGLLNYRTSKKMSIIAPRSRCDQCSTTLTPCHLIPVLSFLFLNGKCSKCRQPIPARYVIIEIFMSTLFILTYHIIGFNFEFIFSIAFLSVLVFISLYDIDKLIILDQSNFALVLLAIIKMIFIYNNLLDHFIGAFIVSIPYFILAYTTQSIGYGDVKLSFSAGLYLGTYKIILAFIISILFAGLITFALLILKKATLKSKIPYAPFLCVGFYITNLLSYL